MDLLNLFSKDVDVKRVYLRPPTADSVTSDSSVYSLPKRFSLRSHGGTDYAQKYVKEEEEKALLAAKLSNCKKDSGKMDEISVGTVPTTAEAIGRENAENIFKNFNFEHRPMENLPIFQNKEEIISTVETHSVTVIEGVTGCGKSTQVPQFILDKCRESKKYCNIIVSQPRRIAALSIADRVCRERQWTLGSIVGCQVGMYRCTSSNTLLTYCTTGVLLRKLVMAKNMLEFTHIILDEVHERDQEMDFLILVIKKFLTTNSRQVKVILMSATFNIEKFSNYFHIPTETGYVPAPIISIGKKRNFKIHINYLDKLDILGALPEISFSEPKVTEKMIKFSMKLINIFDDLDKKGEYDVEDLREYGGEKPRHATLVFLPGIWEIEEMHGHMSNYSEKMKWDIVVLHSSITSEEQNKIFSAPPKGYRRVILSTNIAESSITIDDVKYVIDFCLTKQLVTDPMTNFQCLELTWASKSNCDQRAGRAGRIMDGRVYRLVPKAFYEVLPNECDPEIVRAPLDNLVLQTKLLDMGEPKAILALAIDPPDLSNLERTVLLLKEAGGLLDKPGCFNPVDGELTDLGRIMAALPVDIHIAKLMALGHVFNVLRDTIIMAASMAVKSMFNNPFKERMNAYNAKVHWADGSSSDCMAYLNAYRVWQNDIMANRIKRKSANERSWANRNYIQIRVMHEVDYLVNELTQRLERLGIKETRGPNKIVMDDVDRSLMLKIVIAGAFYPNYFVRCAAEVFQHDNTYGTRGLGGLDPSRTVYLQGWKSDQPGRLYAKRIQEVFRDIVPAWEQALVEFDGTTRVYIMFSDDKLYGYEKRQVDIPGKVSQSVYKALKMRKLQMDISIPVLDTRSARQRAEKLNIPTATCSMFYSKDNYDALHNALPKTLPLLPSLQESTIPIKIVNFINPGKFWVHIADEDTKDKQFQIETALNEQTLPAVEGIPKIGKLVAAKWKQDKMYRAVVESYYKVKNENVANILLIDFGFRDSARVAGLKVIDPNDKIANIPALAFECTLTGIEPSKKHDARGNWSKEAFAMFKQYTEAPYKVFGTIYSVVDSIVSVELICTHPTDHKSSVNLNKLLEKQGLAEFVEESYLSKYNHRLREKLIEYDDYQLKYYEYLQYDRNFLINQYPDPPPMEECRSVMLLKGPYSPLEISLSSLSITTATKTIMIENVSVNSVLVDTNPEDSHERLLVSSCVTQNTASTCLTLRNTTLMPNIPGLTALICLIFAPKIELRRSPGGTYYIGALCGLGCDPKTKMALLPEHDMEVSFDTAITIEDLQNINRLRHWMNMGICVKSDEVDDLHEQAIQCQHKVHEFLTKLINRPTKSQERLKILNFGRWGLYHEELFLLPTKAVIKEDSIYPLHCALQLEDSKEIPEDMMAHVNELRKIAASDPRISELIEVHCKLCDEIVFSRDELRSHLFTQKHMNQEAKWNIK